MILSLNSSWHEVAMIANLSGAGAFACSVVPALTCRPFDQLHIDVHVPCIAMDALSNQCTR